jgi:hypothetical protein
VRDMLDELAAAHRAVARRTDGDGEIVSVQLRRSYDAAPEDVWDAVTDPAGWPAGSPRSPASSGWAARSRWRATPPARSWSARRRSTSG